MLTYLLLTEKCNLNCSHCIRGNKQPRDMTIEDFSRAINQVQRVHPNSGYVLTGGEPTLNPAFGEMLKDTLTSTQHVVIINSNGTTRFFESVGEYASFKNLHIQFSIDGDAAEHDRIRGVGSFSRVITNLERLSEAGMPIWVSTVVTEQNIESMDRLRDVMVDFMVQKWHINPMLPFGCSAKTSPMPVEKWNAFVDKMINETPLRLGIKKLYDFSMLDRMSAGDVLLLETQVRNGHRCNCGCGHQKLYVYPDMTVYGCTCVTNYPMGNLRESELDLIEKSENAIALRQYTLESDSPCRLCRYVGICNGGCVGMSVHEFGRLGVGDVRCPLFRRLAT